MNYYNRNLGDYAKDAQHLSLLEHGAYTLLIDRYYGSEKPIAEPDIYRVARAVTRAERDAVDTVLREFFKLEDGFWTQGRIEREIEKANTAGDRSRENGKAGGRPAKKEKQNHGPPCPQKEIIALYHEVLPELPPVNDFADVSATHLRNQWRKAEKRQTLDWWRDLFTYVRKSPFLMGEKTDFQASLGWIVKPANFAKVVNGNYDDRKKA